MNPYKELVLAQIELWNIAVKAGMPQSDADTFFRKNIVEFHENRIKLGPK